MKKLLLGTAALTLLSTTAHAGPALDALTRLLPAGVAVTFTAERAEGTLEVYEGLTLIAGNATTRIGTARLSLDQGVFGLIADQVRVTDPDGGVTEADRLTVSAPLPLLELDRALIGAEPGPDLCGAAVAPLAVSADGVRGPDAGRVGTVRLDATLDDASGVCVLDLTQGMTDLELSRPDGTGLRIARQGLRLRAPTEPGLPETATGETYLAELTITGAELLLDGAVQATVTEITGRSHLEADSALPLVAAGYNRYVVALGGGVATLDAPAEQLPYADLWNAARGLNAGAEIAISGAEVVGTGLAALIPVPGLLDPGTRLSLLASATKTAEELRIGLTLDGSNTLLLDLEGALRVEPADPSFNEVSPRALVMSAPLSLISGSVRVSDRGIGGVAEQIIGMDPYAALVPSLSGLIGAGNAGLLAAWLEGAQGGAEITISAAPTSPVPVLMLGMLAMGDWSALGPMLNATTGTAAP
jgi:hypothetical protein